MQPMNYSLDVQTPFQAALQGYQAGAAIRNDRLQVQQQEQAMQAQQAQQQALQRLMANPAPTAQDYAAATVAVPGLREQLKQAWDMRNTEQQQSDLSHVSQVYAALRSGKPDIASQMLRDRATALKNAGREKDAQHAQAMAGVAEEHPQLAASMVGMSLAAIPGGDKVIAGAASMGAEQRAADKAPAELDKLRGEAAEATAKAKTAEIAAKYGEQSALLDLTRKGWDITHIAEDIKIRKESNRIAAMNAAAARETNGLKREELQLQIKKAQQDVDQAVRTKAADVESARGSIDSMLNTTDRILKVPDGVMRAALGTVDSRLPTAQRDVADFESLVENLTAQTFIAQVAAMKGLGALSNAEGEKLQASLQSLSLRQSPEQFTANVREVQRLMTKTRKNLTTRYGVPETVPDTPAASPSSEDIDALIKKYAGGR